MAKRRLFVMFLALSCIALLTVFLNVPTVLIRPLAVGVSAFANTRTATRDVQGEEDKRFEVIPAVPLLRTYSLKLTPAKKVAYQDPNHQLAHKTTGASIRQHSAVSRQATGSSSSRGDTAVLASHKDSHIAGRQASLVSQEGSHAVSIELRRLRWSWEGSVYTIDNITKLSQNTDINTRGKWQWQQIHNYCHKYNLEDVKYQLPHKASHQARKKLFRHLIFDDKNKLLFCFIPKVGCSNMRRFMFVLQGIIPEDTIHQERISEEKYLGPGVDRASFLNSSLTDESRLDRIMHYFKFVMVRNPLERLLSAFLDKLSHPLDFFTLNTFEMHKREIAEKYNPAHYNEWLESNGDHELRVRFRDYIQWVVDSDSAKIDEHFSPMIYNACPCRVQYHFYGNFKQFSSDVGTVIEKLGVKLEYFWSRGLHASGQETKDYMEQYYSQLDTALKESLFRAFHQELDFYYHLYPEESDSHFRILGIRQLIQ